MDNNKLLENKLFFGISSENITPLLECIGTTQKKYNKNDIILHEGDSVNFIGAVMEGCVKIIKTDYNGNENIIAEVMQGDIFAEVFACAEISKSPVLIVALTPCTIMYFNYRKIISACNTSCVFHQKLIFNMLKILANKSLYLNRRIDIISKRTLRDKVLTYFHYESNGQNKFCISLNRQELANFLCADRSALSFELSKMKKEGILSYHKNKFELHL